MLKKFNINSNIVIKPNDHGWKILQEHLDEIYSDERIKHLKKPKVARAFPPNEKGYIEMQMWKFMEIFGPKVFHGSQNTFEKNIILIDEKYLEEI